MTKERTGPEPAEPPVLAAELETLRDVEERLRAENEQLVEQQRILEGDRDRFAQIYELAPFACITHDRLGMVLTANLAASELFQTDGESPIGMPFKSLLVAEDRRTYLSFLWRCQREPHTASCEVRLARHGAEPARVRLSSRRIGENEDLYATAISDLREREEEAAERRILLDRERSARAANDAKDYFIATLSHELRTPLTPVLLAVNALVGRAELDEEVRSKLALVRRNVLIEARLIDDLLDATRIARGKMRLDLVTADVHKAASDSLEVLDHEIRAKGLKVTVALEAAHHLMRGDCARLAQVFWNLLRNAVKYTAAGGHIEVRSWNREGWLMVEMSDSGRGIGPDALERLFQPFEQVHDEGSIPSGSGLGLGLAICRGIVELHGGRIHGASPGLGRGARFVVELPTTELAALAAPAPVLEEAPVRRAVAAKILLVEDDEDTAAMLTYVLEDQGFDITLAHSVASALKVDLSSIDLLLSDVGLGDGSGLDLMKEFRTRSNIKGIALSGYGTEADKRASKEAGFEAHLTKPVMIDRLLAAINQVAVAEKSEREEAASPPGA